MESFKYYFVCLILVMSMRPGTSFFHHKKVIDIPVHLKPIHVQPVIVESPEIHEIHHIEQPAPPSVVSTEAPHKHWQDVWEHVKNSVGNHKIIRHFYHKKESKPEPQVPTPEFDVWPSHGFNHYKKIHFIPVHPQQAPIQGDFEFEYLPQDYPVPIPQTFSDTPSFIESSKKPTDFESSVTGSQTKQTIIPSATSEHSGIQAIPNPPAITYGLPSQN